MGATGVDPGVSVLIGYVVLDVPLLLLLQQLRKVGLILVEHPAPLCTDPLELVVWLDAVGVEVLVKTVVFEKRGPVSSVWAVLVKDDARVLLAWQ